MPVTCVTPWVLRVILTLEGAMCVVFRWNELYDAKGRDQSTTRASDVTPIGPRSYFK